MQPLATAALHGIAPLPPRKIVFRILQDESGRWCASSDDGLIGGRFFLREAALRFVRRETIGVTALVLHVASAKPPSPEDFEVPGH